MCKGVKTMRNVIVSVICCGRKVARTGSERCKVAAKQRFIFCNSD